MLPAMFFMLFCMEVNADTGATEIVGKTYKFKKDDSYSIDKKSKYDSTNESDTYGTFCIKGDVVANDNGEKIPSYEVNESNLEFFYNYGDTKLNAKKDKWHIVDDSSKKVSDINLGSKVMKGAIIVQTSKDRKNWINDKIICNAFEKTPVRTKSIYKTKDVQLINGCYYRVIVAYKLGVRTEKGKILFINTDKYKYEKYAEVYEFYVKNVSEENKSLDPSQSYVLGTKEKVKQHDGYFGKETIKKGDIHYGWDLGEFFVNGYTDTTTDSDGNIVFLKNVNDKVTLWFKLKQNIDSLNEDKDLTITADTEGYDQYFETARTNFGKGTLIIRHTDHNNVKSDPIIYTNYLEADTIVGTDTKVQLFDEGDYEVALDYEVTKNGIIDKIGHYRIFFKFSVRNGNCMVYPFDVETGTELTNSSMTENGFRLDLAKSRYLKINLKREVMKDTADGLIEDTRFNGPATDGDEYTDEGIYTITVNNEYTGQLTTKKIYVGTNDILRAHMVTGLTIPEINDLVSKGATISEDGALQVMSPKNVENSEDNEDVLETNDNKKESVNFLPVILFFIIAVIGVLGFWVVLKKKAVAKDDEGGKKE